MQRLIRIVKYLSPWVALGLAGALVDVYLHRSKVPPPAAAPITLEASAASGAAAALRGTVTPPEPSAEPRRNAPASYADAMRSLGASLSDGSQHILTARETYEELETQGYFENGG